LIFIFTADAEDLLIFLLSAETRLNRLSESDGGQGAESKNQQPLGASTCYYQQDTLISALFVNRS